MAELSEYVLETMRKGGKFILSRCRQPGDQFPFLMLAAGLRRLQHAHSHAAELDPARAAQPLALTRHEGRTILVLQHPGSEPMERIFERFTTRLFLFCFVLFFFTISPVSALDTSRQISQYGHTAWRIEDGDFAATPNAIAQSTDGYLWIGTQSGLTRFDGARFVSWQPPQGSRLPSSRINSLLGARDGSLWIGTGAGLARWRNGKLTNYGEAAGSIMAILEDRGGTIWIARANLSDTKGPLCKVTETGVRCYGRDEGLALPYAVTLANDSLGNVWAAGGLMVSRWQTSSADTSVLAGLNPAEILNGVLALASTPDGSLWVGLVHAGKGGGLQQLVQGAWKPFVTPEFDGSALKVTRLLVDRDGSLWVGTLNQGIYRIQGNRVDHFRSSDGLSGDAVAGLFQDREGNIWIATARGIDNFHDLRVASISTRQGLSTDQVNSVLASRDGTVWIGNYNLDVLRSGKISSIQPRNGLPGREMTSLLEDRAGRLWVGTDQELSVYEKGKFTKIHTRDASPLGTVRAMTEDVEGSIWAATWTPAGRYRLLRIQDLRIREDIASPQLPLANTLAADPHGGIWLGLASGGLARYRNGQMEFLSLNQRPHVGPVHGLLVNSDGSVLAATTSGLVGWRNGRVQNLTVRNGLPCDVIYALIYDRKATLWLYAACGLIAIPNAELQRWWKLPGTTVESKVLDVFDGARPMSTPFQPNASWSPDGRLWFANENVVQMIDPDHLDRNPILPPVHVEEIIADHKPWAPRDGLRLPALTRNLEIDYTALSFVTPQKVRFRYKLEGHDSEWQDPGTRRQAFYSDLPPANYRFRVIASNNDGVWNEEGATLAFSVAAAWYQTWWFRVVSLAAFLALLWCVYGLRVRSIQQRSRQLGFINEKLEAQIAERKQAEEELGRSEAFLAEGQRISHTGTWAWNILTGNLVWSEEHSRIFGVDPKEAEPTFQLFWERVHSEDRSLVRQTLDGAIRERGSFTLEFRIALPDGSSKYLYGVGHPVLNTAGDIDEYMYIGTTMDITERKRGEEALRNAQADLTRVARLTTMGELAASIAHEINQPLAAVVSSGNACLRWLANDKPNLDGARGAAERIVRDAHRAGEIIRTLRTMVTKSGPKMTQLDINDMIREVLVLMHSELHQHDVSLETALSDGLEPIMGDRVQLQQVILNLIMNGIEAMSAIMQQPRVLRVRSQIDEPCALRITIEDSGPGLAPEIMERLFDPFFTTKHTGMGMGLSICRSIIEGHGGHLWASPNEPRGAVFQFTVPIAPKWVPAETPG